jgi:glycosyltransferase involved in cell wall biosynthesis
MKVGYLLNSYPMTTTTFIRREIEALERRGVEIVRYAVRRWAGELVDPLDIAELDRTQYLLTGNAKGLGRSLAVQSSRNTRGVARALPAWRQVARTTEGRLRAAAYLAEATELRRRTERDGIGHLHVHFSTNATVVAMLCRLMGGPSYSFTAHGPDEFVNPVAQQFGLKLAHAAFAVAISHYARMQLLRWGGLEHRGKVHVARCGLYLPDFVPVSECSDNKTLVCIGRLCPQKGQVLIPEAIAPLVARHPDLRITMIGDGETREALEAEIARLGLERHFELTGWMENRLVRERLASARALLLPSFAEGLPIVIMEAMALSRPAISTYIAGIPELLDRDCGWIVPASGVAELRGAIADCLDASPRRLAVLGAEGRARIETRHDIDKLAATLHGLFEDAIAA